MPELVKTQPTQTGQQQPSTTMRPTTQRASAQRSGQIQHLADIQSRAGNRATQRIVEARSTTGQPATGQTQAATARVIVGIPRMAWELRRSGCVLVRRWPAGGSTTEIWRDLSGNEIRYIATRGERLPEELVAELIKKITDFLNLIKDAEDRLTAKLKVDQVYDKVSSTRVWEGYEFFVHQQWPVKLLHYLGYEDKRLQQAKLSQAEFEGRKLLGESAILGLKVEHPRILSVMYDYGWSMSFIDYLIDKIDWQIKAAEDEITRSMRKQFPEAVVQRYYIRELERQRASLDRQWMGLYQKEKLDQTHIPPTKQLESIESKLDRLEGRTRYEIGPRWFSQRSIIQQLKKEYAYFGGSLWDYVAILRWAAKAKILEKRMRYTELISYMESHLDDPDLSAKQKEKLREFIAKRRRELNKVFGNAFQEKPTTWIERITQLQQALDSAKDMLDKAGKVDKSLEKLNDAVGKYGDRLGIALKVLKSFLLLAQEKDYANAYISYQQRNHPAFEGLAELFSAAADITKELPGPGKIIGELLEVYAKCLNSLAGPVGKLHEYTSMKKMELVALTGIVP